MKEMKRSLLILTLLTLLVSCGQKNEYRIQVTVENGPDTVMVHNNWYTSSDTVSIVDGYCEFSGVIDTFPKLVSLGFPYPSQERTRMILEPGKITVRYDSVSGFRLGGTDENVTLQKLFDELKPYDEEVHTAWRAWGDAYKQEPRDQQACEETWVIQEEAKRRQREKTRELIREYPTYAGLVITLPIARYETADQLKVYVDLFAQYENDKRYQSIKEQWEVADRTVNGKPAPEFTFPNPEGEMVSLSDFLGKWVLLDFWYVDCPWCRKLSPHLITIYNDWKETRDFEIISISVDKPKDYDRWLEAIEHDGTPWTQVLDSTKTYPLEYGITGYPTLILVDPQGNGVKKIIGYQEEGGLRRLLGEHISPKE